MSLSELHPHRLWEALTGSLRLDVVLHRTLLALREEGVPVDGIFVNVLRAERGRIEFLAEAGPEGGRTMYDVIELSPETLALRRRDDLEIRRVDDLAEDPFTRAVAPAFFPEMRSFVMMRLHIETQHLGVMCFWSRKPRAFEPRHEVLLESFRVLFALNVGFAAAIRLRLANERLMTENLALSEALAREGKESVLSRLLRTTPSAAEIAELLRQAARFDVPVLITGESGTGKEVVANTVHRMSARRDAPFVRVNCSAIPEPLMESEFFGHEAGAFTNAVKRHIGFFEEANGGTLFLDEIGELPHSMQAKLLHALQNQCVRRVGGTVEVPVNVRIIAATNRNLEALVRSGAFRLDLYYRINVLPVRLKPLRERTVDIEPLLNLFLSEFAKAYGLQDVPPLLPSALREAEEKRWPGNVRQLRNVAARTLMALPEVIEHLAYSGDEDAEPGDEPEAPPGSASDSPDARGRASELALNAPAESSDDLLRKTLSSLTFEELQRRYFEALLAQTNGRVAGEHGAARLSGLNANTLRSRLRRLGFERFERS